MTSQAILLPGDPVIVTDLPHVGTKAGALKLGPGLSHELPSNVQATVAGPLRQDAKKKTIWIENNTGRYIPHPNDAVIATVHHSAMDYFHVSLTPHSAYALLPHLAFEHATKKNRPQLAGGALVYARIVSSHAHNKFQEPELSCINPASGKSEGMGELRGGMVSAISLQMAARLLTRRQREDGGVAVLEVLAKKWPFEIAVGRNGYVWVDATDVKRTIVVGRALVDTDKLGLDLAAQEKHVKRLCRELGAD